MARIETPPNLNATTKRFARTLDEAFLCDAEKAQAVFKEFDVLDYGVCFWLVLAVLTVIGGVVILVTA